MKIRRASERDAPRLAELITLAYRVETFFVDRDRTDAADVRRRMRRGDFLVLEDGERLVGCVYVEARGSRGYFGLLSVDPARQRQGVGARLVAAAEAHCRVEACTDIEIEVVNLRTELPPFYRRLGYTESGIRPFPDSERAKRPCRFVVMVQPLAVAPSSAP